MELPARLIRVQRAWAAALLFLVGLAMLLEARSPAANAVRQGKPWSCWLALKTPEQAVPQLFWLQYQSARRVADLVHVPETTEIEERRTLAKAYSAARKDGADEREAARAMTYAAAPLVPAGESCLYFDEAASWEGESALAGRRWLVERVRGAALWRSLLTGRAGSGLGAFEAFRIGLELNDVPEQDLRAAWLPGPADREAFFSQLTQPAPPLRAEHAVTVEVLNASSRGGIAASAKKILRSKGADVMSLGNAPARSRSVVLDRTGRYELAESVRRMLNCPSAEVATQIDVKRLVDVSVVIAQDCPERE